MSGDFSADDPLPSHDLQTLRTLVFGAREAQERFETGTKTLKSIRLKSWARQWSGKPILLYY